VKKMADEIKRVILANFKELDKLAPRERINQRIDKFSAMGVVKE
jgi:acetyl-CoA carboxylase carboxyl transferase subunit alpha